MTRRAGVLLPLTALPGPYGIGDLGRGARDFVGWLGAARQTVWQILPTTIADSAGCPYASPSASAAEPLLLSPDDLVEAGWIRPEVLPPRSEGPVDWETVGETHSPFLHAAAVATVDRVDVDAWLAARPAMADWALFRSIADLHGKDWSAWPTDLRDLPLNPTALQRTRHELDLEIAHHGALQWLFDHQWTRLRRLARAHGVQIWGDLPFFVHHGSVDVWMNRHLFHLDADGNPTRVSGVPPDAFSPTGQRWGHPQYRTGLPDTAAWWVARASSALNRVERLRIDHFRGLDQVWSIPADRPATEGVWVDGPGEAALAGLMAHGPDRWFAEDLGVITEPVRQLRDRYGLAGVAVLQFAFGPGGDRTFLPHAHRPNQVVYPGTHDNDTLIGWVGHLSPDERRAAGDYLGTGTLAPAVLRAVWRSVADTAVVPMQDVLELGSEARTNIPGLASGQWRWRLTSADLDRKRAGELARQTILSGRGPQ